MILLNYLRKLKNYFYFVSCLCWLISANNTAVAEYKKPQTASSPDAKTTTSAATRGGCLNQSNTDLTAIAPYSHVGQTISTHPSFTWFIPDGEYFPLEFQLEEYGGDGQPQTVYRQTLSGQPGIMSLSLPEDLPGLTAGKKYLWKVIMRCTRYKSVVTMAEVEVVAPSPELISANQDPSGTEILFDLYSETGLWYDAIALALKAEDLQQMKLQNRLIQELAALETGSSSDLVRQQGEKLTEISDRLKASQLSKK